MFGLKPLELVLLLAVAYLFYDKFFRIKTGTAQTQTAPLNGASVNTAPNLIKNYSQVGDTFDLEVEALTQKMGY